MRCPACGEENQDTALVCERCQAVLKKVATSGEIRALTQAERRAQQPPPRKTQPSLPATRRPTPIVPVPATRRPTPIVTVPLHPTPVVPVPAVPEKPRPRSRQIILAVGVLTLGGIAIVRCYDEEPIQAIHYDQQTSQVLSFKGQAGTDKDGYPTTTLARGPLLERLAQQDFATLDRLLLGLLAEADRDPRREYHLFDAFDTFAVTSPAVQQAAVNYQAAMPHSPAANAARGVNLVANLASRKGTFALSDLPEELRQQLTNDGDRARLALDRALAAAPGLVPAWLRRLELASLDESPPAMKRALVEKALAQLPDSYLLRVAAIQALRPMVDGSPEAMTAFADAAIRASKNPRMIRLRGFVALDRCDAATLRKDWSTALTECNLAVATGPEPAFLLARAQFLRATTDIAGALRDYQTILASRPEDMPALLGRIALGIQLKKWPEVAADLSLARELDATHPEVNQLFEHTLHLLVTEGLEHERAARFDEAEARYTQALAIAPANAAARIRRDRLENLRTRLREAEASPLDFEAQARLATVYVQDGRFEDVLTLWNSFLTRKPRNGKALLARGQAHFTLGKTDEALADAKAACALGLGEACEDAKRFGTAGE